MRTIGGVLSVSILLTLGACGVERSPSGSGAGRIDGRIAPLDPDADDRQWVRAAKDYASTRFARVDQINVTNVKDLKVAWTFSTGFRHGHEAAPIIANDTMYIVTPFPNRVYAIDLTRVGGPTKWSYDPHPDSAAQGVACCDVVNRGGAYADGRFFFNTLDNRTIALDAETGEELWVTRLGEINKGESMTMAPLVVKGKVLVGNSGGEFGVRGWIAALDAGSGNVVWKAYSTGPDSEVLIGPEFTPHYAMDRGEDLGVTSWPPEGWKVGGGTVWGWISYDPQLDLIYYGTGNPGPWNPQQRPGDNKWTCGIFARDPDTGQARWFYQTSPHDLFDHDDVNEAVLVDLDVNGQRRPVMLRPGRTGYMYVIDRATGEVLAADPFAHITASKGVDLKSGRLIPVKEKEPEIGRTVRDICPAAPGAKDWQPSAFSPRTNLLYVPHQNLCMDYEGMEVSYIAGTPFVGANVKFYPGPGGHRGEFTAWDPVQRKAAWKIYENFPVWSGALATGGDVVFYGTMDGWFKAVHARTGEELWRFKTASGIVGQPVSWLGADGKQYVAILDGVGGWAGAVVSGDLDTRDPTAGHGWGSVMGDLPRYTSKGGTLYVFSLP